jgi:hypothetical protein
MSEKSLILGRFIGTRPIDIAESFGYPREAVLAVADDQESFAKEFPDIIRSLDGNTGQLDDRRPWEFIHNIALSWITEDFVKHTLQEQGFDIEIFGDQKERDFTRRNISGDPDFLIRMKWGRVFIEMIQSYTGYWWKHGRYDLRHNKLQKMKALADGDDKSLILGIDLINHRFFIHNLERKEALVQSMCNTFHKMTSRIEVKQEDFIDWDSKSLMLELYHQILGF